MKILLKKFAKIENADIKIDGITVIGGKNNSGKSTVGKVLFSYFNSFYRIDRKINRLRRAELIKRLESSIYENLISNYRKEIKNKSKYIIRAQELSNELSNRIVDIMDSDISLKEIDYHLIKIIDEVCAQYDFVMPNKLYEICIYVINNIRNVPDSLIKQSIVEDNFKQVFDGQINSFNSNGLTEVEITIKDTKTRIVFENNRIKSMDQPLRIEHDAIFIDNPSIIISSINKGLLGRRIGNELYNNALIDKIFKAKHNRETSFESINAREKKDVLMRHIDEIAKGEFVVQNNSIMFKEKNNDSPTSLNNISMGLKSIALIKLLIEDELISDNDFLVLDEPEVHLHPEWQIKYAEIIILLQKIYNLNILVTTHSRDFFEAIELYSKKHSIFDKCNFYLACEENGKTQLKDLESNPIELYRQLVEPNEILDRLRFELEE